MKRVLITGVAGFVGSHLAQAVLAEGDHVVGVDALTDYYDVAQKRSNLAHLVDHDGFDFVEADLVDVADDVVDGVDVVYHQAGQPGVRASWREHFDVYTRRNILATQRLLEAAVHHETNRVVYASSSSVYGNAPRYPVDEQMHVEPFSPYGVTKLAAENLCQLYAANFGLSTISLRYFTVYGPRQRPDMAFHRLFEAAVTGSTFPLFGTGEQRRDFTYVADVVRANLLAGSADVEPGLVANIAGGSSCTMNEVIDEIEALAGASIELDRRDHERGDVQRTGGRTDVATEHLGWEPSTPLATGLARQLDWHRSRHGVTRAA